MSTEHAVVPNYSRNSFLVLKCLELFKITICFSKSVTSSADCTVKFHHVSGKLQLGSSGHARLKELRSGITFNHEMGSTKLKTTPYIYINQCDSQFPIIVNENI